MWRTMDTAPKDGSPVYLAENGVSRLSWWSREHGCWVWRYGIDEPYKVEAPEKWMPCPPPA